MSEKQGNEIDTDELYADLAWLLNALERDRDVASVPEVVRAAMRYIEARVHEVLDEEIAKVEISMEPGANPIGKLIEDCKGGSMLGEFGIARKRQWDPDNPGCVLEECGGSRLDPCADSLKTNGRTHDIFGDEMKAAGLDPDNLSLRRAVREAGGVMRYQAEKESSEFAKEIEPREIPVSQLVSGDSVYSPSTKTWHEVRWSTAGQLYFRRDERWMPVDFAADVKFLTRRGEAGAPAGLLFDAFGGEVIEE